MRPTPWSVRPIQKTRACTGPRTANGSSSILTPTGPTTSGCNPPTGPHRRGSCPSMATRPAGPGGLRTDGGLSIRAWCPQVQAGAASSSLSVSIRNRDRSPVGRGSSTLDPMKESRSRRNGRLTARGSCSKAMTVGSSRGIYVVSREGGTPERVHAFESDQILSGMSVSPDFRWAGLYRSCARRILPGFPCFDVGRSGGTTDVPIPPTKRSLLILRTVNDSHSRSSATGRISGCCKEVTSDKKWPVISGQQA